jgi:hypothetical protein
MTSAQQPRGLGWFLSEFGYTENEDTLRHMTELADANALGWAYFVWRADWGYPVEDNPGMLRRADGSLRPYARILARAYPERLSGVPKRMRYDPERREFELGYAPRGTATTVIVLPDLAYGQSGACPAVAGASWRIGGDRLRLRADRGARVVHVRIVPGRCGSRSARCAPGRRFLLRLRGRRHDPAVRAQVYVNGRRAPVYRRRGRLVARIVIRRAAARRPFVAVRILVRTHRGRLLRRDRTYRVCSVALRRDAG